MLSKLTLDNKFINQI